MNSLRIVENFGRPETYSVSVVPQNVFFFGSSKKGASGAPPGVPCGRTCFLCFCFGGRVVLPNPGRPGGRLFFIFFFLALADPGQAGRPGLKRCST